MTKFIASTVDVKAGVDVLVQDVLSMGIKGIHHFANEAATELSHEEVIHVVGDDLTMATNVAQALNNELLQLSQALPTLSFNGPANTVAYGGEVVSTEDTAEAAINRVLQDKANKKSTQTKTQTKGEVKEMTNTQTAGSVIEKLVNKGVSDEQALKIAEKFRQKNSGKIKDAQKAPAKSNVKEEVNAGRRGSEQAPKTNNASDSSVPTFGGGMGGYNKQTENKSNTNNGGNEMSTQTQNNTRRGAGAPEGQQQQQGTSYVFTGQTQDQLDAAAAGRTGFDDSIRGTGKQAAFPGGWYLNAAKYPSLEKFQWFFDNRRALPTNDLGLTAIKFLNPKNKDIISYENEYTYVVEMVFGAGMNLRIKLTHMTEAMKAKQVEKGFKPSKSDWKTGNIEWVQERNSNQSSPRYAFSVPNDFAIGVKCDGTIKTTKGTFKCNRTHNVRAKRNTECSNCGKKYDAIELQVSPNSVKGLEFSEYQPQWNKIVLDNFNITVHEDVLALALACAQYEMRLPMHGLVPESN